MSLESRKTKINDREYQMLTPSVRHSMPLCTKVAVLLGPVLSTLGDTSDGMAIQKLGKSLMEVDPEKLDALFMQAVSVGGLHYQGKNLSDSVQFETHFNEHKEDVYHASVWCLWECVKDFFPQLGAFTQQIANKVTEFQSQGAGQ